MSRIDQIRSSISAGFRKKRMVKFMQTFELSEDTRILDIGGPPHNWQLINCPAQITLLNIHLPHPLPILPANMNDIQGDGTCLNFPDRSFDLVFSNSVIEHVGTFENQQKFAREVHRVADHCWIQTPSRAFSSNHIV